MPARVQASRHKAEPVFPPVVAEYPRGFDIPSPSSQGPAALAHSFGRIEAPAGFRAPVLSPFQRQAFALQAENRTRVPDRSRNGLERLSLADLSGVRFHRNSDKPTPVQSLANTQGQDSQVAPGTERHLGHERWHPVKHRGAMAQLRDPVEGAFQGRENGMGALLPLTVSGNAAAGQNILSGNKAVSPHAPVTQRVLAFDKPYKGMFIPETVASNDRARYETSLSVLVGSGYTVEQGTWSVLKSKILANDFSGDTDTIHNYFHHPHKAYVFESKPSRPDVTPQRTLNLLLSRDMEEAPGKLGGYVEDQGCVIQALVGFGVKPPDQKTSSAQNWHAWSKANALDYRTDSDIIQLYVGRLGYSLVNNKLTVLVDWVASASDGDYFVGTYPTGMPSGSAVGHMIGITVSNGAIATIHDHQEKTMPNLENSKKERDVYARYIFKK